MRNSQLFICLCFLFGVFPQLNSHATAYAKKTPIKQEDNISSELATPRDEGVQRDALKLLGYLGDLPKKSKARVLAGQNIGHANTDIALGHAKYFTALKDTTGLTPAILGIDYGWEELSQEKMAAANAYTDKALEYGRPCYR